MEAFQKAIALVQIFAQTLDALGWSGSQELHDWVLESPKIWLTKRRETSLDEIRVLISTGESLRSLFCLESYYLPNVNCKQGIGVPERVDRTETQTISRTEGKHITTNGSNNNEWDAAWSDEEEEREPIPKQGNQLGEKASIVEQEAIITETPASEENQDDDAADAWGWGDEDAVEEDKPKPLVKAQTNVQETAKEAIPEPLREVTLTEQYMISAMPGPVLEAMSFILDDAATLTQEMCV